MSVWIYCCCLLIWRPESLLITWINQSCFRFSRGCYNSFTCFWFCFWAFISYFQGPRFSCSWPDSLKWALRGITSRLHRYNRFLALRTPYRLLLINCWSFRNSLQTRRRVSSVSSLEVVDSLRHLIKFLLKLDLIVSEWNLMLDLRGYVILFLDLIVTSEIL